MKGGNLFGETKYFVCNESDKQREHTKGSTLASYNKFSNLQNNYKEDTDYEVVHITDDNKLNYKNVDQSQKRIDSYYTIANFPNQNKEFPAVHSECVEIKNENLKKAVFNFKVDNQ